MARKWTDEQSAAISARKSNVLLSAAAGSGKTAVLVERVFELIKEGASVDRMLIVTFTRAAAAEMKTRLAERLNTALYGDAKHGEPPLELSQGEKNRLSGEILKLEQAMINTIHGYCSDFLRTHFEAVDIDPSFKLLDDTVQQQLLDESVEEVLAEAYADEARVDLMKRLDAGREIKRLREMVARLYQALAERPDPERWIEHALAEERIAEALGILREEAQRKLTLDKRLTATNPMRKLAEADAAVLDSLLEADDYDSLRTALDDVKWPKASYKGVDEYTKKKVDDLRTKIKKDVTKIGKEMLPAKTVYDDLRAQAPLRRVMADLALAVSDRFDAKKREQGGITFDDMVRLTARVLGQDEEIRRAEQERFDYIFVDEYQDTSALLDAIVARISRGDNRFMVGDIKQSIYRFNGAEPRLFREKADRYEADPGAGSLLRLSRNFRSAPPVIDFVNMVFDLCMTEENGGIDYRDGHRLVFGNEGLKDTPAGVEIDLLTSVTEEEPEEEENTPENDGEDAPAAELLESEKQAIFIAKRIREMRDADPSLKWSDFAILTRKKSRPFTEMMPVLLEQGVPAYADGAEGFFESPEIMWIRSMLALIENRCSDMQLIGVLRSPVFGLTPDELATVRIAYRGVDYNYAAWMCAYPKADGEEEQTPETDIPDTLREKLIAFYEKLASWRLFSGAMGLGELVRKVLDESGYYVFAGALPGGKQRQANLNRFVSDAARFDNEVSGSLTRFLRYLNRQQKKSDQPIAHLLGENDDVVRMMTVHKSKGLQFKVVIGAQMEKQYRRRSGFDAQIDIDSEYGFAFKHYDAENEVRRSTAAQRAIWTRNARADAEEEARLLYVLLTRAEQRLVLVGSVKEKNRAKKEERWESLRESISEANCYLDLIMAARAKAEDEGRDTCSALEWVDDSTLTAAEEQETAGMALDEILSEPEKYRDEELQDLLAWKYPDESASRRPLKLTVTSLPRYDDEPEAEEEEPSRKVEGPAALPQPRKRPGFMQAARNGMTGAERGTAYHRALELIDLASLNGKTAAEMAALITEQLKDFAGRRLMTEVQAKAVNASKLAAFMCSDMGRRLRASEEVHREWSFNVRLKARDALRTDETGDAELGDAMLNVQGTIDCCFAEDGEWVLLDYKTDSVKDRTALSEHYRKQLETYQHALETITGKKVKQRALWLLSTGETLEI